MFTFSFLGQPILNILEISKSLVPGIEKVIALYYDPVTSSVKAKHWGNDELGDSSVTDIGIEDSQEMADKKLRENAYFKWYKKENLPFQLHTSRKTGQMTVFDELDKNVLAISLLNDYDGKYNLLFFFFNKTLSNFGVSDTKKFI